MACHTESLYSQNKEVTFGGAKVPAIKVAGPALTSDRYKLGRTTQEIYIVMPKTESDSQKTRGPCLACLHDALLIGVVLFLYMIGLYFLYNQSQFFGM